MLCRNRVADFHKWKAVYDSHASEHRAAGLRLVNLWQAVGDENNVFFLLEVDDIDRARAFVNDPSSAEAGKEAGVIDGEYHFVEESAGR